MLYWSSSPFIKRIHRFPLYMLYDESFKYRNFISLSYRWDTAEPPRHVRSPRPQVRPTRRTAPPALRLRQPRLVVVRPQVERLTQWQCANAVAQHDTGGSGQCVARARGKEFGVRAGRSLLKQRGCIGKSKLVFCYQGPKGLLIRLETLKVSVTGIVFWNSYVLGVSKFRSKEIFNRF